MEFASEMVVKAALNGLSMTEVPVTLYPDGRNRPPHLRSWRDGWRHLRFLLLFSPAWLFLYPGTLFLALGAVAQGLLLPGPKVILGISFDVHSMLFSAAAVIVGTQLVTFAVFAKVFIEEKGLQPPSKVVHWLRRHLRLEMMLLVGAVLVLAGLGASGFSLLVWGRYLFGPFDPAVGMRIVIPALTLSVVGAQVMLAGLFLSILELRTRDR
jgi:hypothetical protein